MRIILASSNRAVMTTFAGTLHKIMINKAGLPGKAGSRGMTGLAEIRCLDMQCRLADDRAAIVATGAGTNNFCVIYTLWGNCPYCSRVTFFANICCVYMSVRFAG